ncbi:ATP-dependent 6-phosphofructokinase [Gloeocapsa sp. PCC 73106]|uniref:ATP-dependent 6-phosphofructokinase n=1 Tax=Gloeocapsa sp. PCC 73106 TaxID=102232 RepID=UPI0002ACC39C|nr:ATP-dependent 6-phosphofructokinase [Gloeocapsa sp. PCC 73106]ELS00192.1 6-phosphofructokinase [Gloeocapsa sp. PCC 73106]
MKKRIGILTSGGDCPGLNAVIRSVAKSTSLKGWELYGIPFGTDGFLDIARGKYKPEDFLLTEDSHNIPGLLRGLDVLQFLSGSILGSVSKGNFDQAVVAEELLLGYELMGLDALIAIGGDGSLDIIQGLAEKGKWNLIAIPKTIDNDVPFTESSVGFDSSLDIVTRAIYDLSFTAASHERVMILEVMGRDAGHLGLNGGIAGGADIILIPELTPSLNQAVIEGCCRKIARIAQQGRNFAVVVIAEGVRDEGENKQKHIADALSKGMEEQFKKLSQTEDGLFYGLNTIDTRVTVLGHLQRTGTPSANDRILGITFGIKAVQLIEQERYSQLVIWKNGEVQSISLDVVMPVIREAHQHGRAAAPVQPEGFMVQTAKKLGIYLGTPD